MNTSDVAKRCRAGRSVGTDDQGCGNQTRDPSGYCWRHRPDQTACSAALNIAGTHYACDDEAGHGSTHGNEEAHAIWVGESQYEEFGWEGGPDDTPVGWWPPIAALHAAENRRLRNENAMLKRTRPDMNLLAGLRRNAQWADDPVGPDYDPPPMSARSAATPEVLGDHPHVDPGDGRTECYLCGKFVHDVIHSCKGVPVTPAAEWRVRALINATRREAASDDTETRTQTARVRALLADVQKVVDAGGDELDARGVVNRLVAVLLPKTRDQLEVAASDLGVVEAIDAVMGSGPRNDQKG